MTTRQLAALLVWAGCAGAAACVPEDEEPSPACADGDPLQERYGTDCLCCHRNEFGVAGSVDLAGDAPPVALVIVEDRSGVRAQMAPNPYGNFFRHVQLQPPLRAWVVGRDGGVAAMGMEAPHGSCNRCHGVTTPRVRGP